MTESELKGLSITQLLEVADQAISVYVNACVNPQNKNIAEQRQLDLVLLNKILIQKSEKEMPLN